jgi:hypothetical protein
MPFEGGSSSDNQTNVADYSDFANNGTNWHNVTWNSTGGYDGKGAFEFDAMDNHVNVGTDESLNFIDNDFSVGLWLKSLAGGATQYIITKGRHSNTPTAADQGWGIYFAAGGQLQARVQNSSGAVTATTPLIYNDGNWHHVMGTYDRDGDISVYVDGDFKHSVDMSSIDNLSNTRPLIIGRYSPPSTNNFNGTIDDVLIFNRSLSADQIAAIYNNRTDLISSDETSVGNNWSARITPNDGTQDGTEVCSENLIVIADNAAPLVFDLIPTANSIFNIINLRIEIAVNVTDNTILDSVSANITSPSNATTTLNLNLAAGDKYNASYGIGLGDVNGTYNVIFTAYDINGNINDTETTNFTVNFTANYCGNNICETGEDLNNCSYDCGYLDVGGGEDNNTSKTIFIDSSLSNLVSDRQQVGARTYRTMNDQLSYLYFKINTISLNLGELGIPYHDAILEIVYQDVINETTCTSVYFCRPYIEILLNYGSPTILTSYLTTKGLGGVNDSQWKNTTLFFDNYPRQELRSIGGVFEFRIYYPRQPVRQPLPIDYIRFQFVNRSELVQMKEKDRSIRGLIRSDFVETNTLNSTDYTKNYVTYSKNYLEKVYPNTIPAASEVITELSAFEIKGNYEPITFSIYAFEDLENINISVSFLTSGTSIIPTNNITIEKVVAIDKKWRYAYNAYYGTNPWYLDSVPFNISANTSQQIWLTIYVPENVGAGNYTGTINILGDSINSSELNLTMEVFDLSLEEPDATPYLYHSPYFNFYTYSMHTYSVEAAVKDMSLHNINPIIYNFDPSYDSSYVVNFSSGNITAEVENFSEYGVLPSVVKIYIVGYYTLWYNIYGDTNYFQGTNTSEFDNAFISILNQTKAFFESYGVSLSVSFVDEPEVTILRRRIASHLNRLARNLSLSTWVTYTYMCEKPLAGHEFYFSFQDYDSNAIDRELNISVQFDYSSETPDSIYFSVDNRTESNGNDTIKKLIVNNQEIWNITTLNYVYQAFNVSIVDYLVNGENNITFSFINNVSDRENFSLYFNQDYWRNKTVWNVTGNGTFWNYSYTSDDNGNLGPLSPNLDEYVIHVNSILNNEIQRVKDNDGIFSYYTDSESSL